jgi:predicted metal-dependent peptidase
MKAIEDMTEEEVKIEAKKALSKAKITLMGTANTVFFAYLTQSLSHGWDDNQSTAYTDAVVIKYNRRFYLSLPPMQRVGVTLHEVLHVALFHCFRGRSPGMCQDRMGIACDYVVNAIIKKAGFPMPEWVYYDKKYEGMGAVEIYHLLPDNPGKPNQMDDLKTPGSCGEEGKPTKEQVDAIQAGIDNLLIQASIQSKLKGDKAGTIPGQIERYIDNLIKPKIYWYTYLRKFMVQLAKSDFDRRIPNRRFFPKHFMPTLYSQKMGPLVCAMDISYSIEQLDFDHFMSETQGAMKQLRPDKLTFIQWDTGIVHNDEVKTFPELKKIKFGDGGGTDVDPVLQWAKDNKPEVMVIFTDGEFSTPTVNPGVPIIWVIHTNDEFECKFGKIIYYEPPE